MSNEKKPIATKDKLQECSQCGSTEFCLTQEFIHSFTYVRCRQCDKIYGTTKYIRPMEMLK